jgi:histidinol-phosphate aminotransferase
LRKPITPIEEAIAAAQAEVPRSNCYTEPFSGPLRRLIADGIGVPEQHIHINAGSEIILRQIFSLLGRHVHLLTPTYPLFPEIAKRYTETRLLPENEFAFDIEDTKVPDGTTLTVIVNPNNPNGDTFDMAPLRDLLKSYPDTRFLVDEAFISLAGFRIGYAVLPEDLARKLNASNDAYPLTRPGQAAALATLQHEDKIRERVAQLRSWTEDLAIGLRALGIRTFATQTYFFLADFAPHDAGDLAEALRQEGIYIKALGDPHLGKGYMRVTTALPKDNARFLEVLRRLM